MNISCFCKGKCINTLHCMLFINTIQSSGIFVFSILPESFNVLLLVKPLTVLKQEKIKTVLCKKSSASFIFATFEYPYHSNSHILSKQNIILYFICLGKNIC